MMHLRFLTETRDLLWIFDQSVSLNLVGKSYLKESCLRFRKSQISLIKISFDFVQFEPRVNVVAYCHHHRGQPPLRTCTTITNIPPPSTASSKQCRGFDVKISLRHHLVWKTWRVGRMSSRGRFFCLLPLPFCVLQLVPSPLDSRFARPNPLPNTRSLVPVCLQCGLTATRRYIPQLPHRPKAR